MIRRSYAIIVRIFFSNAGLTKPDLRSLRFRLVLFLVKMWFANECPRLTFPLEVSLNRFLAPLCDFIFGTVFPLLVRPSAKRRPHSILRPAAVRYRSI
jgi:hypothetical protein